MALGGANILINKGETEIFTLQAGGVNYIGQSGNNSSLFAGMLGGYNVIVKKGTGKVATLMAGGANVLVHVGDGETIGARFFLSNRDFPTIIFFHGNAELAQEYDDIANYYNRFNINFIVVDYQGYGLSTGTPTKENLHQDANTAFIYIKEYLEKNKYEGKIVIMGRSLGSASAFEIINNHSKHSKVPPRKMLRRTPLHRLWYLTNNVCVYQQIYITMKFD